jgi:zinc/manganese transport system permease protein
VNPALTWNLASDVRELVVYPFMVNALEAGAIVSVAAAVAGWFMVLRREAFAGHTLSLMSFPGAAAAALLGLPLAFGYFGFAAAAALAIAAGARVGGRRDESQGAAVIGTVQAVGLGLGFLFLGLYHGVLENLESLLFGSFLGITRTQVATLLGIMLATVAFFAVAARPLLYASVDEPGARARGVPVRVLNVAFLVALALAVAATVQITGVLLVFALLVAPPAAAQQLTMRLLPSIALGVVIALAVTWIGLALAYFENHSLGFYVTTLAFVAFVAARVCRALSERR